MKKTFIYIILILISCMGFFSACEDMYEVHEKFVENGEILYLTKVDSVEFFAGNNRGEVQFVLDNAIKVNRVVIYWNNKMDSIVTEVEPTAGMDTVRIALNDLPEGSHQLEIVTKDILGNKSIGVTVFGVTYGDKYKQILKHRAVQELKVTRIKTDIAWMNSAEKATAFELKYINVENEEVVKKYEPSENMMTITDIKIGTNISHRMHYLPEATALDTFQTDWLELMIDLPTGEFELDKTQIKGLALKNDNLGESWGGSISKLFDDILDNSNHYHTGQWNDGPPLTFTFDLGDIVKPTRIKIDCRPGQAARFPKNFDIWGTSDLTDAETDLSCDDPGWEAEAISKGWTKIAYHEGIVAPSGDATLELNFADFTQNMQPMQYVRIRVNNVWDNSIFLNLGEITMWGEY
ncbi:DUF4998 domain-containing protein [Sunxiuqinia sp. sy24]|uniref:DUF4998 domain-containing protein n=1 Tax=Sunxiuqinia sp. sy24 TaxID=3461495 RepID=UPI004045A753